jgi:hypothetical protein
VSGEHLGVLVLGVALVLLGWVFYWVGKRAYADALRNQMSWSFPFSFKASQVIGALLVAIGAACIVGSGVGAIFGS